MKLTDRQALTLRELAMRPVRADVLNAQALLKFASLSWCDQISDKPKIYQINAAGRRVLRSLDEPADPTPPAPAAPAQRGLFDE